MLTDRYVDMDRMNWDQHPEVNQSLLVPEFTYGMMSPTAPLRNRHLVWHIYSGQSYRQYSGDLDFYFGGFDYRGKLETIDTSKIPVAMLTGEYDWVGFRRFRGFTLTQVLPTGDVTSNGRQDSRRLDKCVENDGRHRADQAEIMNGLGHFPATENPKTFVGYLIEAIDHVNR